MKKFLLAMFIVGNLALGALNLGISGVLDKPFALVVGAFSMFVAGFCSATLMSVWRD